MILFCRAKRMYSTRKERKILLYLLRVVVDKDNKKKKQITLFMPLKTILYCAK